MTILNLLLSTSALFTLGHDAATHRRNIMPRLPTSETEEYWMNRLSEKLSNQRSVVAGVMDAYMETIFEAADYYEQRLLVDNPGMDKDLAADKANEWAHETIEGYLANNLVSVLLDLY